MSRPTTIRRSQRIINRKKSRPHSKSTPVANEADPDVIHAIDERTIPSDVAIDGHFNVAENVESSNINNLFSELGLDPSYGVSDKTLVQNNWRDTTRWVIETWLYENPLLEKEQDYFEARVKPQLKNIISQYMRQKNRRSQIYW